jgi:hypothetical protein
VQVGPIVSDLANFIGRSLRAEGRKEWMESWLVFMLMESGRGQWSIEGSDEGVEK